MEWCDGRFGDAVQAGSAAYSGDVITHWRKTLRIIADQIERGDFGEVGSAGFVLLGSTMEVFGMGTDSEAPSVALLLHAGFTRLSNALEQHGRDG
jgi:hypothetical protein